MGAPSRNYHEGVTALSGPALLSCQLSSFSLALLVTMADRLRMQPSVPRLKDGTPADVEQEICDIIAEQLGVARASITRTTSFEELGADISDMAALIVSVEEAFGVEIRDEEVDRLLTVRDFIAQVKPVWFSEDTSGSGSLRT